MRYHLPTIVPHKYSFCAYFLKKCHGLKWLFLGGYSAISTLIFSQVPAFSFEELTTLDGLSHNIVQCILQDKQGYMWFGTEYGLNRYDGYAFKVFKSIPGDSLSLPNNNIISLYEDVDGLIWIGTSTSAFSCYNPRTETFKNYVLPQVKRTVDKKDSVLRINKKYVLHAVQAWIHDFIEDDNGFLWLATGSGLFSFDKKNGNSAYHATDDSARENVHGILKDKDKNILWLSTETGIRKYNKKTRSVKLYAVHYPSFFDIKREITHNIIEDRRGDIWMTTSDWGVQRLNPKTGKLKAFAVNHLDSSSSKSRGTTQIMEDNDGKIWIAGEGLAFFDPSTESLSYFSMTDSRGFPGSLRTIFRDRSGIYWIGTETGIKKYDPKLYSFTTVRADPRFTVNATNTLLEDKDHKFWCGNYGGFGSVDLNTAVSKNLNHILGAGNALIYSSVLSQDGTMWFGSTSCLFKISKKYKSSGSANLLSTRIDLPLKARVGLMDLAIDRDGIMWIGTRGGGLFRYDPVLKTFKLYEGIERDESTFSSTTIWALHAISADSLLIGAEGEGLILMHTKKETFERIKLDKSTNIEQVDYSVIKDICGDKEKNIWIATENGGLWQANAAISMVKNYAEKDGLHSMKIEQVIADDVGQIWLNTNLGLEVIDPTRKRFVYYSAKDGLNNFLQDFLIKKSNGDMLFLDFNGLHTFHPSGIHRNTEIPRVYINHLKIADRDFPVYGDTTIHLAYNKNFISFEYVALNYTQSFKNNYAFKLEGLENNWVDAGDRRFTSYTNLPAGTFTFRVKASNNDGIWNEEGAKLTVIIFPAWYQTWWFIFLTIAGLSGLLFFAVRYYYRQQIKRQQIILEGERALTDERNRIASDMHDDVGAGLSRIRYISASMQLNQLNQHDDINKIVSLSDEAVEKMNEIIWSLNQGNQRLEELIYYTRSQCSEMVDSTGMAFTFNLPDNIPVRTVGWKDCRNIYLLVKEAVNNAVKHSGGTSIVIECVISDKVTFSITDDGKGFDSEMPKKGSNGLVNYKKRVERLNGDYLLVTSPGCGTKVVFTVPVNPV